MLSLNINTISCYCDSPPLQTLMQPVMPSTQLQPGCKQNTCEKISGHITYWGNFHMLSWCPPAADTHCSKPLMSSTLLHPGCNHNPCEKIVQWGWGGFEGLFWYLNHKLHWTDTTNALYKKARTDYLLKRLKCYGVQGPLLRNFQSSSVVWSAMAVASWLLIERDLTDW